MILHWLHAAGPAGTENDLLSFIQKQGQRAWTQVPPKVLAFYYVWYGNPEQSGRWRHWRNVQPDRHFIASATHYPALGAYDSHDPQVIRTHIRQAQQAGIDGFIVSWWGQNRFEDKATRRVLQEAERLGFQVTVYWETAPGSGEKQIRQAVSDLTYLLRRYGSSPAFLKVQGKPVLFVYGRVMHQIPASSWPEIIRQARAQAGDFLLIADGYSIRNARLFDGVHTYNIAGSLRGLSLEQVRTWAQKRFPKVVHLARRYRRIACLTVIPGYDDTKIRHPGLRVERHDGRLYQLLWDEAIQARPDWILITSWNEWHEGSEIEPSWEYGQKYLDLTRSAARRFHALPAQRQTHATSKAKPAFRLPPKLMQFFQTHPIGLWPDFKSALPFLLVEAGVPIKALRYEQLVQPGFLTPKRFPILLYASGEHYRSTVHQTDDVLRALQNYLHTGGTLVCIPAGPYPFYYDEAQGGRARVVADQVGLPVRQGWETPPNRPLRFRIQTRLLSGLPETVPFPDSGDLRWRPAWPQQVGSRAKAVSLIRLEDPEGRYYGDGALLLHWQKGPLAGGHTLYVWMRLPELCGENRFLKSLFSFLAKELSANE